MRLQCQHCYAIVKLDDQKLVGCLCDPDAPTWIAISPDGRIMSLSHASYEYLPKEQL